MIEYVYFSRKVCGTKTDFQWFIPLHLQIFSANF